MINMRDVLILAGLLLIGTGLYFRFGYDIALIVDGAIITLLAIFGITNGDISRGR